jgi:hypothetical protein
MVDQAWHKKLEQVLSNIGNDIFDYEKGYVEAQEKILNQQVSHYELSEDELEAFAAPVSIGDDTWGEENRF